jgi:twitching motility protein PilT
MNLEQCLARAQSEGVSDLHLSEGQPLRARRHGVLVPWPAEQPLRPSATTLREWLSTFTEGIAPPSADAQAWQRWLAQAECDSAKALGEVRVRAHLFWHDRGLGASLRLIPTQLPSWEVLGVPEVARTWLQATSGLVLVTGATGSGKSTTLAALVHALNAHQRLHIITLEDPIEFVHQPLCALVHQRQLHRDFATFDQGLKAALRQDPDVILVGELRDLNTIRLALQAAETGHLVLASLHTRSAPQTVERLVDVFAAEEKPWIRNQLSLSLHAVICQHLLPRSDGGGRVAAHEVMVATPAIRHLIREGKSAQMPTALQTGAALGMCTLAQSLQRLVHDGLITPEVAQLAL